MTDAFTDDFAPTPLEAARVVFPVSRLVCDVERFPHDADEPMALRGMGAVYVKTTDGRPPRDHLTTAERTRLIETWCRPHHQKLTVSAEQLIADGRSCINRRTRCQPRLRSFRGYTGGWLDNLQKISIISMLYGGESVRFSAFGHDRRRS